MRRVLGLVVASIIGLLSFVPVAHGQVDDPSPAPEFEATDLEQGSFLAAEQVLRVSVPDAFGGKTVVGQIAVDNATAAGYVTAFGCDDGLPRDPNGDVTRADLNFDGTIGRVWSNRMVVQADADGDICFSPSQPVSLIVDVSAVTFDNGITSFPNRRVDTRRTGSALLARTPIRINVPEAVGGRTVVGLLAVDGAIDGGYVTAFGCDDGLPTAPDGETGRADLNYDGNASPVWSNRLIAAADADGDLCFYSSSSIELIVDINGVADGGFVSFPNRRVDTRLQGSPLPARRVSRIRVPEAAGGKTVIGQVAVDNARRSGYVAAYPCADGLPVEAGEADRADLNFDGFVGPVWSNRLIVAADANGEVCLFTSQQVDLIVDVSGVVDDGLTSFPSRRIDTRRPAAPPAPPVVENVPTWPAYTVLPAQSGTAALTGLPIDGSVAERPVLALKVDNFRLARPHVGLGEADVVFELNVEGISRFLALFHSRQPSLIGPIRSARTADVDLLIGMNQPIFGASGSNPGVGAWLDSASSSSLLVNAMAQRSPCYRRESSRPGPHNLFFEPQCARDTIAAGGPARPLWSIDGDWAPPSEVTTTADGSFEVRMDGVSVGWTWDPGSGSYLRSQDGAPHLSDGRRLTAANVVVLAVDHPPSPVDARSPNPVSVGSGPGMLHRDGLAIPITWTRAEATDEFTFEARTAGVDVPLDEGTTFVELIRSS